MDFLLRGARQRVLEGGHDLRELRLAHPQELLVGVRHVGVHASLPLHKVAARPQRLAAQGRIQRKEVKARVRLKPAIRMQQQMLQPLPERQRDAGLLPGPHVGPVVPLS